MPVASCEFPVIFATVGTQLPFPRLAGYLQQIARSRGEAILFQSADSQWSCPDMEAQPFMTPAAFDAAFQQARVIVGHAGIGTVLTARRLRKPLIIVPRRFALGEHRNDHQMATAAQLGTASDIVIANDCESLAAALDAPPAPLGDQPPPERDRLIAHVARFLEQ